jgi:DNA-directed RNA polymerase subunit RPC12/RpoP
MKLINYRCVECGQEEEWFFTSEELKEAPKEIECLCGRQMTQFNFTNNNTIQKFDWNK